MCYCCCFCWWGNVETTENDDWWHVVLEVWERYEREVWYTWRYEKYHNNIIHINTYRYAIAFETTGLVRLDEERIMNMLDNLYIYNILYYTHFSLYGTYLFNTLASFATLPCSCSCSLWTDNRRCRDVGVHNPQETHFRAYCSMDACTHARPPFTPSERRLILSLASLLRARMRSNTFIYIPYRYIYVYTQRTLKRLPPDRRRPSVRRTLARISCRRCRRRLFLSLSMPSLVAVHSFPPVRANNVFSSYDSYIDVSSDWRCWSPGPSHRRCVRVRVEQFI